MRYGSRRAFYTSRNLQRENVTRERREGAEREREEREMRERVERMRAKLAPKPE
jgi:hypothetical protein